MPRNIFDFLSRRTNAAAGLEHGSTHLAMASTHQGNEHVIEEESVDNLLARWEELREQGKEISPEELCRNSPKLLTELKEQIQALSSLEWLADTHIPEVDHSTDIGLPSVSVNSGDLSVAPSSSNSISDSTPSTGSRFQIVAPHAKGGLGEVFLAKDEELNREVALKEIQTRYAFHPEKQARFLREAQITGNLEHPGIVPVYGLGHYPDGRPYYAMRFIKGETLREAIDRYHVARKANQKEAGLELRKLLSRFIDVCNAIEYAHSRRVMHRDLKPANIMLGKYGETLVVDWGLAKIVTRQEQQPAPSTHPESSVYEQPSNLNETQMGSTIGTPAYMAPEQAAGKLDKVGLPADVYSLGATLYHLLTGKPPFTDRDSLLMLQKARIGDFPAPRSIVPSISQPLEAICLKAMALEPENRYPSAKVFAEDLEHWLADEPVTAHRGSFSERVGRWSRRHRSWTQAAAMSLVVVATVSVVASFLVSSAQLQETKAWEVAAKTRLVEVRLLNHLEWNEENLSQLAKTLTEIKKLSPTDADVRQRRLFETFAADMQTSLEKARFTDADQQAFDHTVKIFVDRFPESNKLIAELQTARDARLRQWNKLLDPKAFIGSGLAETFDPQAVVVQDGTIRRRANSTTANENSPDTVYSRLACPPGNIELKATFGRNWTSASMIGLVLNLSENHRYDFLVTVPQFDYRDTDPEDLANLPPVSKTLRNLFNNRLEMYILRDGQPLAATSVSLPKERLRIMARREGGHLSFTINDTHTLQFEDPFPVSATEPGVFGLYFPKDVELEDLQAMHLKTAAEPSPVERGDELYAQALFSDALADYRKISNVECQYKRALCLLRLQQTDEAVEILTQLFAQPPGTEPHPDDAWRLRAGCSLLQHYVESKSWSDVDRLLDGLASYYTPEQIALLIPKTQIELILQHRRREKYGSLLWTQGRNLVDDLNWTIRVEELFDIDPVRRRKTRAKLAGVHQWNLNIDKAFKIWNQLLTETERDPATTVNERLYIITRWGYLQKLLGRSDEAIKKINDWLLDDGSQIRDEYLPLLVIRALCHQQKGDKEQSASDLDQFLKTASREKVNYAFYSGACLMRGMMYEDVGDEKSAQRVFRDGLRRNWPTDFRKASEWGGTDDDPWTVMSFGFNALLMSWTGELTKQEAAQLWDMFIPGTGAISASVKNVAKTALTPELIQAAMLKGYRMPLARAAIREFWYTGWYTHTSMRIVLYPVSEGVRIMCLRDLVLNEEEQREIDKILIDACQKFIDAYTAGIYNGKDLQTFLNLVRGRFNPADFNQLVAKHPDREFSMWIPLAFGNKFALDGKPKIARYLFDIVLKDKNSHPAAVREIKRKLARMEKAAAQQSPDKSK